MSNAVRTRPFAQALNRLRDAGLRPTRQRLALAKRLFDGHDRHVTAERLHEETQATGGNVSLATVYNTLHQFTAAGLLREVVVDSGRTYFDTNTSEHHHFYYEGEGRLEDVPEGEIAVIGMPEVPPGKTVSRVEVVLHVRDEA